MGIVLYKLTKHTLVYTCQRPQTQRCGFFLWTTDAEAREKLVVLANSRSEPDTLTKTPSKPSQYENGLPTPVTNRKNDGAAWKFQTQTPSKSAKARMMEEDSDTYDWDSTLDEGLDSFLDRPRQPDFGQDLPRKAPRTPTRTSPRKRKLSDFAYDGNASTSLGSGTCTPQASQHSGSQVRIPPSAEVSLTPTPSRYTNALSVDSGSDISEFAGQALKLLESHNVVLPRRAQNELVSLLNTHDLKTKGIIRGRDISRVALKKKDEVIKGLNERVQNLESQRELDKTMGGALKRHRI